MLVTGAFGNVGRTALYVAKQRGARVIAGVRTKQKEEAKSLGADQIVATDRDEEIAALPQLDAIADTVGHGLIEKLIVKLKRGRDARISSGAPKAAEGREVRVEAVLAHPDAALLRRLAEAVRDRKLDIPIARKFSLKDAGEAQALSERGGVDGKILLIP